MSRDVNILYVDGLFSGQSGCVKNLLERAYENVNVTEANNNIRAEQEARLGFYEVIIYSQHMDSFDTTAYNLKRSGAVLFALRNPGMVNDLPESYDGEIDPMMLSERDKLEEILGEHGIELKKKV